MNVKEKHRTPVRDRHAWSLWLPILYWPIVLVKTASTNPLNAVISRHTDSSICKKRCTWACVIVNGGCTRRRHSIASFA